METNTTWDDIRDIFEWFKTELAGFDVITEKDLERYRLSKLTFGLINTDLISRIESQRPLVDKQFLDSHVLVGVAYTLTRAQGVAGAIPSFIRADMDERQSPLDVVARALQAEVINPDALLNSVRIAMLVGALEVSRHRPLDDQFVAGLSGVFHSGLEVQHHWYAQWLNLHSPSLVPRARGNAEVSFAGVCADIAKGTLMPWGPYPKEWYRRCLNKHKEILTDSFYRLSEEKLQKMLIHELLTPDVLPPLQRDQFQQRTPGTPGGPV